MSQHPNTYICAILEHSPEVDLSSLLTEDGELAFQEEIFSVNSCYNGTYETEEEHTFVVSDYITYGWGDTIGIVDFTNKWNNFISAIENWASKNNCKVTDFRIGSNFW